MNEPPGARARVALAGLTLAEHFRDKEGQDVLLFVDNIFRFTQAGSEMEVNVYFLALSSMIAASYSAPAAVKDEPIKKVIFADGKKGPDDTLIGKLSASGDPGTGLKSQTTWWHSSKDNALIAYVEISEVGSSKNATAAITSGGVGSDHLSLKSTPYNGGGWHFEVDIWGTVTK